MNLFSSKKKRLRGNWWFHRMQMNHAITCYQRALEFLYPSIDLNLSSDWKKVSREWEVLGDERLKVHYNLGIAYMKQGDYDQALENINIVLEHDPKNLNALYRKGLLLKFNEEYEASYIILLEINRQTLNDIDGLEREINFVRNKFHEQQKKKLVKVMDEDLEMWSNSNYERVNYISNKKDKVEDQNKFMQGFLCVLTEVTSAAVIIAIIHRYF